MEVPGEYSANNETPAFDVWEIVDAALGLTAIDTARDADEFTVDEFALHHDIRYNQAAAILRRGVAQGKLTRREWHNGNRRVCHVYRVVK